MTIDDLYNDLFDLEDAKFRVFRVKVIKCSKNTFWYADKIGKIYNVVDEDADLETVILYNNGKFTKEGYRIKKSDAIIYD